MLSILTDQQHFRVLVHPVPDWANTKDVLIEVTWDGVLRGKGGDHFPRISWDAAYRAFAEHLDVNEHQLWAMSKGLDRGRTLRFELDCRRSELERVGFIVNG